MIPPIATDEMVQRARETATADDFAAWVLAQRQDHDDHRTEYQRRKSQREE